jgi:hypothetical protein
VLLGGIIIIANYRILRRIIEKLFQQDRSLRVFLLFSYFLRFLVVAGIVFLIVYFNIVHPMGFLVGLSTLFLGIILETLIMVFKKNPGE